MTDVSNCAAVGHLKGEVDGPVVRLETYRAAQLQDGLMGGVKPLPQARDPVVVVMASGRVVVWLVVIFFMFPQQVGVEVTVENVKQHDDENSNQASFESFSVMSPEHCYDRC